MKLVRKALCAVIPKAFTRWVFLGYADVWQPQRIPPAA